MTDRRSTALSDVATATNRGYSHVTTAMGAAGGLVLFGAHTVLGATAARGHGYAHAVALLGTAGGLALVGTGIWMAAFHPDLRYSAAASGTAVGPPTGCDDGGACDWTVRWTLPSAAAASAGSGGERILTGVRQSGWSEGRSVEVRYDPARPDDGAVLASDVHWRTTGIIVGVVGVVVIALAWLQVWLARRYKWFEAFEQTLL